MSKTAYLVLENGKVFKGKSFGVLKEVVAEVVFTTGMTGYLETLTDKSYFGQMLVQTFPLIGNYGVISSDFESETVYPRAYIVNDWCREPSNFRSEGDLDTFLKQKDVVGLYGIDTRALTRIIRENGVMNGCITEDPDKVDMELLKKYTVKDAIANVSCDKITTLKPNTNEHRVVLLDFGYKAKIAKRLLSLGCEVTVCPYDTTAEKIKELAPDGILLSDGPGNPAENTRIVKNLKEIVALNIPIFGIGMGHQLLALTCGFKTSKLKYGHRGANQPVKCTEDGLIYITSQNHGYTVESGSIDHRIAKELFYNLNDNTNEGIKYLEFPAFSVQFHPEACSGNMDAGWIFDRFVNMMNERKGN